MASAKQRTAARKNVTKAAAAAKKKTDDCSFAEGDSNGVGETGETGVKGCEAETGGVARRLAQ
jgi:hypothetical protein